MLTENQRLIRDPPVLEDEQPSHPFKPWTWGRNKNENPEMEYPASGPSSFHESIKSEATDYEAEWSQGPHHHALEPLLLCSAFLGLVLVFLLGTISSEKGLDKAAGRPILRNMGTASFCFGIADIIAQVVQHDGNIREAAAELSIPRAIKASILGLFINGIGYSVWLYYLDHLVPQHDVGLGTWVAAWNLLAKSMIDSYVWGILSNSAGIVGRRLMDGDNYRESIVVWQSKITTVTLMDFQFWPLWGIINFQIVPKKFQVSWTALGAIVWNIYMSLVSNWEKGPPKALVVRGHERGIRRLSLSLPGVSEEAQQAYHHGVHNSGESGGTFKRSANGEGYQNV